MSELTDDRLLPCPFCGGKAYLRQWSDAARVECTSHGPRSNNCGFTMRTYLSSAKAIAAWNRRAAASTSTEGAGVSQRETAIEEMAEALRKCLMTRTGDAIKLTNVFVYERAGKALQAYRALTPPTSKVTDEAEERK